ncbi:hypothetical protein ABQD61_02955 [Enterococcus asini]|uniref:hypothetical protein n=1 Tax=Enterococcus asini TaxID=57732 RepID=UPI0032E4F6F1
MTVTVASWQGSAELLSSQRIKIYNYYIFPIGISELIGIMKVVENHSQKMVNAAKDEENDENN